MATAHASHMAGLKRYEDFDAWKLSVKLRDEVFKLLSSGRVTKDFKFCDQIRESTRFPPRNIAEGFGRFKPRQFAQ